MNLFEPSCQLKRDVARDMQRSLDNEVRFQASLAAVIGSLIFVAIGLVYCGRLDILHFMFVAVFLICLQFFICWLLYTTYKFQEKVRLLSIANALPYISIPSIPFFTLQYSPPVPVPVFSF